MTFTLNEANIQVPVLVGIKFLDLGVATLRAQVGPTANFTLASTTLFDKTFKLTNHETGEEVTLDENKEVFDTQTIAWGMQAGLGADIFVVGTSSIFVGASISPEAIAALRAAIA